MPDIKPLAEFNRNQSAVIDELHRTKQPVYLTRNGSASLVVMDAEAFDAAMSYKRSAFANEMRVYDHLLAGYRDYLDGNLIDADIAEEQLLSSKGFV